jgi:tetrahydromethanopterin S-methyltransferase subunit E
MKVIHSIDSSQPNSPADRKTLVAGLTLIALGLSVLFLNSWDTIFVRAAIGIFWGTFFLISNWSGLVSALRGLRQKNDIQRRSGYRSSTQW